MKIIELKTDDNLLKITKLQSRKIYLIETIAKIKLMIETVNYSSDTPLNIEIGASLYINIFKTNPLFCDLDAFMCKLLKSYEIELQDIENKFYLINELL